MTVVAAAVRKPGTDIVAQVEATPLIVLTDKETFSQFYEAMREECDAHVPDLTTEKGRKAIASLAYKVARTKTAIDDAGKKLNEEARARINAVDESRRAIREQLDALKDEVRAPLTAWEEAEAAREEKAKAELDSIRNMGRVEFMDAAEDVKERLDALQAMTIDTVLHGESAGIASAARSDAITALEAAHERLTREEQERAELERLRAAEAERQRIEAEQLAAAQEEQHRVAAEQAEAERLALIEREAEERAKAEAAAAELHRVEYAKAIIQHIRDCGNGFIGGKPYPFSILIRELEEKVEIDESFGDLADEARTVLAENLTKLREAFERHLAKAEEDEAAKVVAEAARLAEERVLQEREAARVNHERELAKERARAEQAEEAERARAAAAEQEAAATRAREADREHRGKIMGAAKEAIMEHGSAPEAVAKAIVLAIAAGSVPHVSIRF